jgi:ribosome-binding protein aMBF1 (putative translation factor)
MQSYTTLKQLKKELFKDPKFKKAYDDLGPEFEVIEAIIKARAKYGLTQADLAKKIGTKQSAISRLESGTYNPSLAFLKKLAKALNAKLEIRIS